MFVGVLNDPLAGVEVGIFDCPFLAIRRRGRALLAVASAGLFPIESGGELVAVAFDGDPKLRRQFSTGRCRGRNGR